MYYCNEEVSINVIPNIVLAAQYTEIDLPTLSVIHYTLAPDSRQLSVAVSPLCIIFTYKAWLHYRNKQNIAITIY